MFWNLAVILWGFHADFGRFQRTSRHGSLVYDILQGLTLLDTEFDESVKFKR